MKKRGHEVNRAIPTREDRACSVLIVDVGGHAFALPARDVVEVLPMAEVASVGGERSVLAGFLNLCGEAIAVVSASMLLGIAAEPAGPSASIVLVRDEGERIGLIVSGVKQVSAVEDGAMVALAGPARTSRAARIDGRIIPVLSAGELLLKQERARIAELRESREERVREAAGVAA